ncbi:PHP domain-containing protein [Alkalihalobacterium chitinilyticum]|uniref:PHP domain-containing protein n=1 Tax=Alkalihalobacterium chitinilyticum TaxID=2980103 RepID=A0ABT5VEV2_9BACI|nr:PHP domain-containing protein [Alkalihalobacterium chitinilyticum]MDE5413992.1 PHP domain-containing protein [Alkalihalobacterium chitinilyticum]
MKIDLHMHSTHSDGELQPAELVREAYQQGVSIMSITDHDEISAYGAATALADELGIKLIPGIEMNTDGPQGELHILGYGLAVNHPQLHEYIHWRQEKRKVWSQRIVNRLNQLGYAISWDACWKRANQHVIVRTHIADELVERGYFASSKEAFQSLLAKGKQAFVNREGFTANEAIELIQKCGGKAFIAHPGIYTWNWQLDELVEAGLDGVEVYYSKHSLQDTTYWLQQAKSYGLSISVGSDFHGKSSRNPYPIGSVPFNFAKEIDWLNEFVKTEV